MSYSPKDLNTIFRLEDKIPMREVRVSDKPTKSKSTKKRSTNVANAHEPAYFQVAEIIKSRIAEGQYRPDQKIPSEKELGLEFGLSLLTIRQAVGLLATKGVLKKIPSKGTYVQKMDWTTAYFNIVGLSDFLAKDMDARVKILKASLLRNPDDIDWFPGVELGRTVVMVERLLLGDERPIIFQESYLLSDPRRPILESELEATYMDGLFTGGGDTGLIQKATMDIYLGELNERQAMFLNQKQGDRVFVLEYTFFDHSGHVISRGRFWVIPEVMRLTGRVGLWQEGRDE
jgi:GntR family transcriptional regulator